MSIYMDVLKLKLDRASRVPCSASSAFSFRLSEESACQLLPGRGPQSLYFLFLAFGRDNTT